jgi:hypothetical protein
MEPQVIEVRGLKKDFDGVAAVDGADFATRAGEYLVLLGPSGCGKTTGASETTLGPGGIDVATANCPPGYRVVYGNYDSLSPGSQVFFSGSFGSERTWYVGLDNFDNRHSKRMGAVKVSAACAPSENSRSERSERAARQRVNAAVRQHMTARGYDEEYGDFGAASIPMPTKGDVTSRPRRSAEIVGHRPPASDRIGPSSSTSDTSRGEVPDGLPTPVWPGAVSSGSR